MAFFTCIQSNIHENFNPKKFVIWVVQSFFCNTVSKGLFLLLFHLVSQYVLIFCFDHGTRLK